MADETKKVFATVDFVVFLLLLAVPSLIGVYFAYKDRKSSSTNKYFFGEKKMNPISVGISTAVTSISAITMIAYPAEVYLVGTVFFWAPFSIITAAAITVFYYVPFYSNLQLDTIFGYLELRFNAKVRRVVAGMVTVSEIFFMGSIIYLPAMALNAVAPISISWSIVLIGGICTFYTTLGGMQAVVWTDVVQSVLMAFASVMLLVRGTASVGGITELGAALERGNRTTFLNFDNYDISSRMHPIAISIGEFFVFTHYLGFSQPIYQRILSCKNKRQSQYSIIAYIIPALIIICVSIANGLLMYAYFEGCDPVETGEIESRDQGVPYMALVEFSNLPGMSGLFVAAVFSGTLSTISSGLNACSVVIVEDFICAIFPKMSERVRLIVSKVCGLVLGILIVSFSYVIAAMGDGIFKIMRCFVGAIGGSVLGIYLLGIFLPWSSSLGAVIGGAAAYVTMVWIFLGSTFLLRAPPRVDLPPISSAECPVENATFLNTSTIMFVSTTTPLVVESAETWYTFDQVTYSLNFHYYVMTGCLITLLVGIITSFITGPNKPSELNPELFMPIFENRCFPKKFRKFFRFGVPEKHAEVDYVEEEAKTLTA